MITAHIIVNHEEQAREIARWLLQERFAFDSVDVDEQESFTLINGALIKRVSWKLQARTKAMLFERIDKGLHELFSFESLPFFYCTPIVQMNAEMSRRLRDETLPT
ncbi:MAG: divalent cation tolerance protein CutA [Flavobacteriales bacterium]|jgi:uncharacterized protein involved in tolerance to divalent cations